MTILEKIKFEEDWLSEVSLTKENVKIALEGIRATVREQQPCEDCISLNKLNDIITKAIDESENQTECQTLRWVLDVMSELPSVTPKQKVGKWISGSVCNRCNHKKMPLWQYNYCPNCGAKMEVEDETI